MKTTSKHGQYVYQVRARCYTKFDWVEKNVEPKTFHAAFSISAFDVIMKISMN